MRRTCGTLADESPHLVQTLALVETGPADALVHLRLTVCALKPWDDIRNTTTVIQKCPDPADPAGYSGFHPVTRHLTF